MSVTKLDLSKAEDVKKFHEAVNELRQHPLMNSLFNLFSEEDIFGQLDDIADEAYSKYHENDECEPKKEDKEKEIKIERPSEKLTTEQGLQIHKLVQEYIDTMIKPYAPNMDTKIVNDAYAGLYEFAAWILNK